MHFFYNYGWPQSLFQVIYRPYMWRAGLPDGLFELQPILVCGFQMRYEVNRYILMSDSFIVPTLPLGNKVLSVQVRGCLKPHEPCKMLKEIAADDSGGVWSGMCSRPESTAISSSVTTAGWGSSRASIRSSSVDSSSAFLFWQVPTETPLHPPPCFPPFNLLESAPVVISPCKQTRS